MLVAARYYGVRGFPEWKKNRSRKARRFVGRESAVSFFLYLLFCFYTLRRPARSLEQSRKPQVKNGERT